MRLIDADALKRKAQRVATEAWKMRIKSSVETILNQFIDWIDAQPTITTEPHWIPVSERLPEPDERVLVYTVGKEFHIWDAMPHRGENYAWEDEEGLYHSLYEADLWMPLPEPYKVDDE